MAFGSSAAVIHTKRLLGKTSITFWIFFGMALGLGIALIPGTKPFTHELSHISKLFLTMVKALIVPLMFSTLVVGIAGHGEDLKRLGRLAIKSFIYFEVATTIALVVGLLMVNWIRPGQDIDLGSMIANLPPPPTKTPKQIEAMGRTKTWHGLMEHTVTESFYDSAVQNEVLQVVFCAIMFAVGMILTPFRFRKPMLDFLESLSQIMFKVTELVMNFAPVGVACAIAYAVGENGPGILVGYAWLIATLYSSLLIFMLLVFLPVLLVCRVPFRNTFRLISRPALIAFSTTSSEAGLPLAMENLALLGVPPSIVAFVMPTGYSFNLDGTTLHLAVASIFAAQAANIDIGVGEQLMMMVTLMLTSKGVAAVPRASLVILTSVCTSFNIPEAAVMVILGVDAFLDMGRTACNLIGNCVASVAIACWENEFDYDIANGYKKAVDVESEVGVQATAPSDVDLEKK